MYTMIITILNPVTWAHLGMLVLS